MDNGRKYVDYVNVIGETLKKIRIEKNMTLEKLSNKLSEIGIDITVTSLYRIEHKMRIVRDYELCGLCAALGIHIEDLVTPFLEAQSKLTEE